MPSSERGWLRFISDSIARIDEYLPEGSEAFGADPMCQDAVRWRIHAIADVAQNRLSDTFKSCYPDVRWRALYGFRGIVKPQPADVNLDLVWEIATEHLGELKAAVDKELP